MNAVDLKDWILSFTQDIEFYYNDVHCLINPYNAHKFYMGYKDIDKYYTDIDELMSDPIFDGKPLRDIAGQIELD